MWSYDLVIINPYAETDYSIHTRKNVNVGILSLASYICSKGYRVKILDFGEDKDFLEKLQHFVDTYSPKIVGVSSTSCFSHRTLKLAIEKIKLPEESILIAGGQHVAGLREKIFIEAPRLKYACFNEGESTLLHILEHFGKQDILSAPGLVYKKDNNYTRNPPKSLPFEELGMLNYRLYPNYIDFIPTIEESRGCPYKCNFCANQILKFNVRIKKWESFISEALNVYEIYGKEKLFLNIGCSTFGMDEENTLNLFKALILYKDKFLLQVWTRCDTKYEEWIPYLKKLDISSVFFGMESASEKILLNMNKTNNPKEYIRRSQHLIDLFYENNLRLWCNFIFGYVGETPDTIYETLKFILENKDKIGFLTGHGLIAFPGNQVYEEYECLREKYGISFDDKESIPELLHFKVNPSIDFTFAQVTALAQILIKIVNTKENFKRVYAWKWLGLEENDCSLDERTNYLKNHELPYRCCDLTEM